MSSSQVISPCSQTQQVRQDVIRVKKVQRVEAVNDVSRTGKREDI